MAKSLISSQVPSNNYLSRKLPERVKSSQRYIQKAIASNFPPALAYFKKIRSEPFHLYNAVGLDKLQTIYYGILSLIPDWMLKVFAGKLYNTRVISNIALVRVANQRFLDLPRCFGLNTSPFR